MRISDLFESRYLRAADLPVDRDITVEIASVTVEDLVTPDGPERKGVVRFVGHQRGLVLNKTNANTITEMLGTQETEHWIGKRIALFVASAPFRGRVVPAIRVRPSPALNGAAVPTVGASNCVAKPLGAIPSVASAAPATQAGQPPVPDDEIPF